MSVNDNKKVFKVTLDSKEMELCVIRPNVKQRQEGQDKKGKRHTIRHFGMQSNQVLSFVLK